MSISDNGMKRFFLILVGLAIVAVTVYAFLPQPVLVDLVPIVRGSLQVSIEEDGKTRIKALRSRFPVTGAVVTN